MRADQLVLHLGLAPTRSAAARLIERGAVELQAAQGWKALRKAGEDLDEATPLRVTDDAELRWVSRAGLKLDGALAHCKLEVAGAVCLDVGQSTGGFTEVLLSRGAAHVVGVDVGHGQLHHGLRGHPQVTALEGLNARSLTREALVEAGAAVPDAGFAVVVADLSFIPLTTVLPALVPLIAPGGTLLALVKPQFELQPIDIGKGGIVKHAGLYVDVERKLRKAAPRLGLELLDYFDSPIAGGGVGNQAGNREFFIRARPA